MHVTTSSHILSLAEDHVYSLRKIGSAGDNSWLDSRRGEAFDRKLQVKLNKSQLEVYFEGASVGYVGLSNTAQVKKLLDLVRYWNLHISPTDMVTVKTIELVRDWPQLLMKKDLNIKTVTFNCAGLLGDLALRRELWSKLFDGESLATQEDIIAVGFQESDNLNRSVKANASTLQRCTDLSKSYLYHSHTLVSSVQLLGLMTLLFVRNPLVPRVSNVTTDTSSTGFLRVWGNKGAVLTKLNLFRDEIIGGGLELNIVNCHLSAGEGVTQIGRRRWELREIGSRFHISGLAPQNPESDELQNGWDDSIDPDFDATDSISSISDEETIMSAPAPAVSKDMSNFSPKHSALDGRRPSHSSVKDVEDSATISEFDQNAGSVSKEALFHEKDDEDIARESENEEETPREKSSKYTILLGDLNYRVLLPESEAQNKVKRKEWDGLLSRDSLSLERRQFSVFSGFEEAAVTFPPTFKYEIGSMKFKGRVPSYTDRILYRTSCPTKVISYTSISDLTMSDHRPVALRNSVEIQNCVDPEKHEKVMARALKIVDEAENNARPKLSVDQQQITLEGPPLSIQQCKIIIRNDGLRPVHWVAENAQQAMEVEESAINSDQAGSKSSTTRSSSIDDSTAPSKTNTSIASGKIPGLFGQNLEFGGLKGFRRTPETKSLISSDTITITPGDGKVTASRPTETVNIVARVGVESRDFIVLVKTQCDPHHSNKAKGSIEEAVHKYVFVNIKPKKSYLGSSMKDVPQVDGVPVPMRECVKYLWNRKLNDMFTAPAEPSIFQQVLSWLDKNEPLDHHVLDTIVPDSDYPVGVFAVAQVLLNMFRYLPDPLMGPNIHRKMTAVQNHQNVLSFISKFINHLDLDDDSLDMWAAVLYDRNDKKAGTLEKRAYLRSVLICN